MLCVETFQACPAHIWDCDRVPAVVPTEHSRWILLLDGMCTTEWCGRGELWPAYSPGMVAAAASIDLVPRLGALPQARKGTVIRSAGSRCYMATA